jgi:hypothetical protein
MKQVRYLNIPLTIPQATVVNTAVQDFQRLDPDYNRITGIAVTVMDDGGAGTEILVGARSNRRTVVDEIPVNTWDTDSGVPADLKYLTVNEQYGPGDTFYVRAIPLTALSSDALIYMVLRLEIDATELPK